MKYIIVVYIALMIILTSCGGRGASPVPRRTAYQRVYEYDSAFISATSVPVRMLVNANASTSTEKADDGSIWFNVSYPRYGATIYITFTPVDKSTAESVIDNRTERIHLNLGSVSPSVTEFTNHSGYYTNIIKAPSVVTTPLQFISVNPDSLYWVVSGAVFFENASAITSVDSIAPVVNILDRDLTVMLNSIDL